MLKKPHLKLKEQAGQFTLREAREPVSVEANTSKVESLPASHAESIPSSVDQPKCDDATATSDTRAKGSGATPGAQETAKAGKDQAEKYKAETDKSPTDRPIKGAFASKLSHQDLTTIAMHPESIEADWLPAFTELSKRSQSPGLPGPKRSQKKIRIMIVLAAAAFAFGSATFLYHRQAPLMQSAAGTSTTAGTPAAASSTDAHSPYLLRSAQHQTDELKQRARIRLAQTIDERGWTNLKAANYLGVSEKQINSLQNGDPCPFNMEELNKMLFAVGASTVFPEKISPMESQQTITYFTRVIALDPNNAKALSQRAAAYEELNQWDLAMADLNRCVMLTPDRPGPRSRRVLVYEHSGRYQKALDEINELHKLFPDYEIYQNRAIIYTCLKQFDKSIEDSSKSIALMDSPRPGPYLNRAVAYEQLGKYKEAIADYQKVLEIDPTYTSATDSIKKLENKL